MKKEIGKKMVLYPTPAAVLGTVNEGAINWMMVAHVGIIGHDKILLSIHESHKTARLLEATQKVSINLIEESFLDRADYVGIASGDKIDKSQVFEYELSDMGLPLILDSPMVMACHVESMFETEQFKNFICSIDSTYAEERVMDTNNKINYEVLKPVLFEMPTYSYLRTGDVIGKCRNMGKAFQESYEAEG